jgi:small subunit ribosomal protein S21
MINVEVKDGESLDRALRRYKKKYEKLGILKEVRKRMYHTPDSVKRREEIKRAKRREQYLNKQQD